MTILPPGSTIGILGGGQLGRMTAMAAAKLGYKCRVFCPAASEPAVEVCAFHTQASFDDIAALKSFADSVDVVTTEWENIPVSALEAIGEHAPVHPSADALEIAQNRELEKEFAREAGVGTADFEPVRSLEELEKAMIRFGGKAILKSARMGYDGKGQVVLKPGMNAEDAWKEMGDSIGILEAFVDFACELSVIVAANANGDIATFPAVQNVHKNGILSETIAPANVTAEIKTEAEQAAILLAKRLGITGLLAVEFFVLKEPDSQGRNVLMNEMAPRPHNSGHWTMDACSVSQFEQLVRAICGLPLGDTTPHSRAVMKNLIGEEMKDWPEILKQPQSCLHLYGKTECREGRKMGHVTKLLGSWNAR